MNINYVIQHISYHLHTIVNCFSLSTYKPPFSQHDWKLLSSFCARSDFQDDHLVPAIIQQFIENTFEEVPTVPLLIASNELIVYAFIPVSNQAFIIGPVCFPTSVQLKYQLKERTVTPSQMETIATCTFHDFTADVLLLHNLFTESILNRDELIFFNCMDSSLHERIQFDLSGLIFNTHETNLHHNPYDQELREFSSIENGDIQMLKKSLAEDYLGQIGTLAKDELRHMKNRAIVVITLASRAAIRGGLLHEISFSMCDVQIQKIEEQTDPIIVLNLMHQFEFDYAQMIADLKAKSEGRYKKNQNLRVNQCKDYIFKHLHEKILIQDIANELHLYANYLSQIFREYEGGYNKRVHHAKQTRFGKKSSYLFNLHLY